MRTSANQLLRVLLALLFCSPVSGFAQEAADTTQDTLSGGDFTQAQYEQARRQVDQLLFVIQQQMDSVRPLLPDRIRTKADAAWPRIANHFERARGRMSHIEQMRLDQAGLVGEELQFKYDIYLSRSEARPAGMGIGEWFCEELLPLAKTILDSVGSSAPGAEAAAEMAEAFCNGRELGPEE